MLISLKDKLNKRIILVKDEPETAAFFPGGRKTELYIIAAGVNS
jgi:hypothetical protein